MDRAAGFHWVEVNRDHTPDIPKRFHVSAYPSLLVLGTNDENVHRWKGFKKPADLLAQLDEALRRHALYKAGAVWYRPTPRPADLLVNDQDATATATPLLPTPEVPQGCCWHGGAFWFGVNGQMRSADPATGATTVRWPLPQVPADLASDGTHLWSLPHGWTKGDPIQVLDPADGRVVREVVTAANAGKRHAGANGIAWRGTELWVLEGMGGTLHRLDPATGDILQTARIGATWCGGLATEGERLVTLGRSALHWIEPGADAPVRSVAANYWLRVVATDGRGTCYALEQPVFDFGPHHESLKIWPEATQLWRVKLRRHGDD